MANRQYVGARYVPAFANPVEWDNVRQYDALTIVTHLGNSFTSKKPVPAGIDIGNTDYWVNTGNYNEQIAEYQKETQQAITLAQKATKRNVILIGDSYGTNNGGGEVIANPYPQIVKNMGLFNAVYSGFANGAGFVNGKYLENIQALSIAEPDDITDIFVLGGWNDRSSSYANLNTAMGTFTNYCKNVYNNAKLHIAFISFDYTVLDSSDFSTLMATRDRYYTLGSRYGYVCHYNMQWVMRNHSFMISDNKHPNQNGMTALAVAVNNCLIAGSCDVGYRARWDVTTFEPATGVASSNIKTANIVVQECLANENITIGVYITGATPWAITLSSGVNVTGSYQTINIGSYKPCLVRGYQSFTRVPVTVKLSGATTIVKNGWLVINNGALSLILASDGVVVNTVTGITICGGNASVYDSQCMTDISFT